MQLKLSRPEFARLVNAALRQIPPRYQRYLERENVSIMIARQPSPRQMQKLNLDPKTDSLFGLYEGIPRTERSSNYHLTLPDRITIFQDPLEQAFPGHTQLKEQVRRTLMHEIAHFFGIDDDELDRLGY